MIVRTEPRDRMLGVGSKGGMFTEARIKWACLIQRTDGRPVWQSREGQWPCDLDNCLASLLSSL